MIRRFFAQMLPPDGGTVELDKTAAKHARVLRLTVGDPVRLFDGGGAEAHARVVEIGTKRIVCEAAPREVTASADGRVVLVQCIPKGAKLESIVRMSTEVGVHAIHLAASRRAVAKPDPKRFKPKLERLGRVAREAARQAQRSSIPEVHPPEALETAAGRAPASATRIVLVPGTTGSFEIQHHEEVWLVVGPEGGLDRSEISALTRLGYVPATIGPTILRVDTAGPVAVALALDRLGSVSS